jgi:hypothetical protein
VLYYDPLDKQLEDVKHYREALLRQREDRMRAKHYQDALKTIPNVDYNAISELQQIHTQQAFTSSSSLLSSNGSMANVSSNNTHNNTRTHSHAGSVVSARSHHTHTGSIHNSNGGSVQPTGRSITEDELQHALSEGLTDAQYKKALKAAKRGDTRALYEHFITGHNLLPSEQTHNMTETSTSDYLGDIDLKENQHQHPHHPLHHHQDQHHHHENAVTEYTHPAYLSAQNMKAHLDQLQAQEEEQRKEGLTNLPNSRKTGLPPIPVDKSVSKKAANTEQSAGDHSDAGDDTTSNASAQGPAGGGHLGDRMDSFLSNLSSNSASERERKASRSHRKSHRKQGSNSFKQSSTSEMGSEDDADSPNKEKVLSLLEPSAAEGAATDENAASNTATPMDATPGSDAQTPGADGDGNVDGTPHARRSRKSARSTKSFRRSKTSDNPDDFGEKSHSVMDREFERQKQEAQMYELEFRNNKDGGKSPADVAISGLFNKSNSTASLGSSRLSGSSASSNGVMVARRSRIGLGVDDEDFEYEEKPTVSTRLYPVRSKKSSFRSGGASSSTKSAAAATANDYEESNSKAGNSDAAFLADYQSALMKDMMGDED